MDGSVISKTSDAEEIEIEALIKILLTLSVILEFCIQ